SDQTPRSQCHGWSPSVFAGSLIVDCRFSAYSAMRRMQRRQRETDGHACPELVDRMATGESVAHARIEGQVLAYLPDQSDEAGDGFRLGNFLLVEDLRDRPHRPLRRPFDDHAGEEIGVVFTGELRDTVQVNGAPVPALRYDAGQACAEL